jgi:hypothetical protein
VTGSILDARQAGSATAMTATMLSKPTVIASVGASDG